MTATEILRDGIRHVRRSRKLLEAGLFGDAFTELQLAAGCVTQCWARGVKSPSERRLERDVLATTRQWRAAWAQRAARVGHAADEVSL